MGGVDPGAQFLVTGVLGPGSNAHGPNEYLHVPYATTLTGAIADIVARVDSIEYVHAWVKAGVMIRETLTASSPHALMLVSPGKGVSFQRRLADGGVSTSTTVPGTTAPAWVKLERRGATITAYASTDGTAWTPIGSDTFTMGPTVHVGLAVSSHVSGRLATATFSNVSVTAR